MKIHGTLSKWNDDRGFGFITPAQGGAEIFVHVSAFPRDGQRPRVGEILGFEIETGPDGRKRATALTRPQRASSARPAPRPPAQSRPRRGLFGRLLPLLVIALLAVGYDRFGGDFMAWYTPDSSVNLDGAVSPFTRTPVAETPRASAFRCDGRTHCSQMTSCEEATYFQRNCPGTMMDGDNDGIPCEAQWC